MKNVTENGDFVPEEQEINLGPRCKETNHACRAFRTCCSFRSSNDREIFLPCARVQSCDAFTVFNIHFHKAYIYNVDASTQIQIKVLLTYLPFLKEMFIIEPPISAA